MSDAAAADADADAAFERRVRAAVRTAQAWDEDPSLLAECRRHIPFRELSEAAAADDGAHDPHASRNLRFLRRLARWFQRDFMTWVDRPRCGTCRADGATLDAAATRGPRTPEERRGGAHRVEVYTCGACGGTTEFPRYTAPRVLLAAHRGRCGEYANLFGLFCRACGLETRQVCDWTDHVWNEVLLDGAWVMVDSCEGVVGECSMYEAGWGKQLSVMVAAARDHVVDVTPRYTRKFQDADFQARRRGVVSSERQAASVLASVNATLQRDMSSKLRGEMEQRLCHERESLEKLKAKTVWEKSYHKGRISGSWIWKMQRHETGTSTVADGAQTEDVHETGYEIETFLPPETTSGVFIQVDSHPKNSHHGIVVSGTACAVGNPSSLSVVVVDQDFLGCILLSRSFSSIPALARFLESVPVNRVIAMQGSIPSSIENEIDETTQAQLQRLGGIHIDLIPKGILFIGQLNPTPTAWTICEAFSSEPKRQSVQTKGIKPNVKLTRFPFVLPATVVGRLPDSAMPLAAQLVASEEQKRSAFETYMKEPNPLECSGFVTRDGTSVYLLGATAFPFERLVSQDTSWSTYLLLPPPLAEDIETTSQTASDCGSSPVQIEVPINFDFFVQTIGMEVLMQPDILKSVDTISALSGARLVALYFSAHWCGPCRSFTPMLVEMYIHLKEKFPEQGLEIVFVSSDRDEPSFRGYYTSMPWLAIPFQNLNAYKHMLSAVYDVRGIPSLVVLDSISGEIVSPTSTSRGEVIQACRQGDYGIETLFRSWLDRVPSATKDIIQMLEISCVDSALHISEEIPGGSNTYVQKMTANDACHVGPMNDLFEIKDTIWSVEREFFSIQKDLLSKSGKEAFRRVLETSLAYLENVVKAPHNPRYRSFKLSNKIADRITKVKYGIELIRTLGFDIIAMDSDFYATVLLETDVDCVTQQIKKLLKTEQPFI